MDVDLFADADLLLSDPNLLRSRERAIAKITQKNTALNRGDPSARRRLLMQHARLRIPVFSDDEPEPGPRGARRRVSFRLEADGAT